MQKYFILFLLFPFLLFSSSDTLKWDSAIYDGDRSYSQYTKNTIKDNLTDLIWEKGRSSYGLMWGEAEAYCIDLELDGFDDWRLPYYEELYYLADRKKSHPAIDSKYFDEEDGEWYWSRTLYKFESETAWLISFTSGYDSFYGKTSLNFARCVRDIEKVEKKNRDLIWQDSSQIVQKDWKNAIKYCKNLSLDGYTDWKLPTIDQLMTITDKTKYKPSLKEKFKNFKSDYYWTSSEYIDDSKKAWSVSFLDGGDFYHLKNRNYYIRCVRR